MSILGWIGGAVVSVFTSIGHSILELFGLERKREVVSDLERKREVVSGADAKEAVNARIRREWLEVGNVDRIRDDGIEYEGEIYYETVK